MMARQSSDQPMWRRLWGGEWMRWSRTPYSCLIRDSGSPGLMSADQILAVNNNDVLVRPGTSTVHRAHEYLVGVGPWHQKAAGNVGQRSRGRGADQIAPRFAAGPSRPATLPRERPSDHPHYYYYYSKGLVCLPSAIGPTTLASTPPRPPPGPSEISEERISGARAELRAAACNHPRREPFAPLVGST